MGLVAEQLAFLENISSRVEDQDVGAELAEFNVYGIVRIESGEVGVCRDVGIVGINSRLGILRVGGYLL